MPFELDLPHAARQMAEVLVRIVRGQSAAVLATSFRHVGEDAKHHHEDLVIDDDL